MHQIPSKVLMHFCFMCNAVVILQRNFHNIRIYVFKHMISSRRASNEPPTENTLFSSHQNIFIEQKIHQGGRIISAPTVQFVQKTALLRSGIICFVFKQTVFTTAIFHFTFSIFHLINLSSRIGYGGSPSQ